MKTGQPWFSKINSLFKVKTLNDDIWDDLEEALILSDVGVPIASGLLTKLDLKFRRMQSMIRRRCLGF